MIATTDPIALLGSISSLIGTATVAYVAISARRATNAALNREHEAGRERAASARTLAAVATKTTEVATALDTNTTITQAIHAEVKAINGTTGTELLEAQEGRRIQADIPPNERSPAEAGYADRAEAHDTDPERH